MSEPLRVALVCEGPTDKIVLAAILPGLLRRPVVVTMVQPMEGQRSAMRRRIPVLFTSSSATASRITSRARGRPRRLSRSIASSSTTVMPFMSKAPRPQIVPSASVRPAKGGWLQRSASADATSRWLTRHRGPSPLGAVAGRRAMRFARPSPRSCSSAATPSASKRRARYSAAAASAPGGFVVSSRRRSTSRPRASAWAAGQSTAAKGSAAGSCRRGAPSGGAGCRAGR